jgi:hypothetical protein
MTTVMLITVFKYSTASLGGVIITKTNTTITINLLGKSALN